MKEKLKKHLTRRNIIYTAVGLFFLVNFIQIHRAIGTFDYLEGRDSSLISEIGQIKSAYLAIGEDLNEVRGYLKLPTGVYGGKNFLEPNGAEEESVESGDRVGIAMFKYVDFLVSERDNEMRRTLNSGYITDLINSGDFQDFLTAGGLKVGGLLEDADVMYVEIFTDDDKLLVRYEMNKHDGKLTRLTSKGDTLINADSYNDLQSEEIAFIRSNKLKLQNHLKLIDDSREALKNAATAEDVVVVLEELGVTMNEEGRVFNSLNEVIAEIQLDEESGKFRMIDLKNGENLREADNVGKDLLEFLRSLDTTTDVEKKADEALATVKKTIEDPGFQLILEESGLSIAEMREDTHRVYFDIIDENKEVVSSLVVEKSTGIVSITDGNGANGENILYFDPDFKKKTLEIPEFIPEYGDEAVSEGSSLNILLAGKHGSLIDTMIFAHIDEIEQEVHLISIPRDLFYDGRKINALAMLYGMPELKRVISDLSGYQLDYYVLIDMYAFIDVVDSIGGIDVSLEQAVVDPYYRVVDNGVEGTLNYPPGDYHLGGVEALRLARSRKTSSDFARAERQQLILDAIKEKVKDLGVTDIDTLYSIARSVMKQVETDMSFDDAIAYYFRYRDYEIASNDVISSGNILMSPPYMTKEDCAAKVANGEELDCEGQNIAYTLVPRDDNWDLIKWFFRERFE